MLNTRGLLARLVGIRCAHLLSTVRHHSDQCSASSSDSEKKLIKKLRESFPKASDIHVHDVSGGCGTMYEIYVVSEEFRGTRTVAQHRMINLALKDEIKSMHGLRISTAVPDTRQ